MTATGPRGCWAAILVIVFLTGCAVSGPPFQKIQIPEGKSVIYAYRQYSFFGSALRPTVSCGQQGISLDPGGYRPFVVDPGSLVCRAATEAASELALKSSVGQESYVKEEIGWGFFVGRPHLYLMDKTKGESEIKDCKLQQ